MQTVPQIRGQLADARPDRPCRLTAQLQIGRLNRRRTRVLLSAQQQAGVVDVTWDEHRGLVDSMFVVTYAGRADDVAAALTTLDRTMVLLAG